MILIFTVAMIPIPVPIPAKNGITTSLQPSSPLPSFPLPHPFLPSFQLQCWWVCFVLEVGCAGSFLQGSAER